MGFRPRQLTKSIDTARRKMSLVSKRFPTKCTEQGIPKWRVLTSRVAFVWRSKIFPTGLTKILLHLFEEDTLLFLSVGKLWLKAVYQVVIFVSEICQFYVCQKSVK